MREREPDHELVVKDFLLQDWMLLPTQLASREQTLARGARNLMFELLASALHDLDSPAAPIRRQAEKWLLAPDRGALTCGDVCAYLNIEYSLLQQRVRRGIRFLRSRRTSVVIPASSPPSRLVRNHTRDRRFDDNLCPWQEG